MQPTRERGSETAAAQVPRILKRLRILEFTLDHEAPYFSNMRRRTSRRDSDLNGVVDVRYTGGARMLLLLEVGGRRLRVKVLRCAVLCRAVIPQVAPQPTGECSAHLARLRPGPHGLSCYAT